MENGMGIYAKWILPRVIDLCMRNREVERYRARVVPQARERVLEIGIGSGLNLPFYGEGVQQLYGLDPSAPLLAMARERTDEAGCPVTLIECGAEAIPLEDGSIDTVVMTFTLCSVADPLLVLREIRRVLRPHGALLFAEHGLAPEARVRRWQRRLTPGWRHIAGGCHLDRKVDALIGEAGFTIDELVTEYARGPRPMTYIYCGRASSRLGG
jgi:ubiquinone/menaquinone biosynthesis C-methylase UbiE